MNNWKYSTIGVMSGTSLDGIDLAYSSLIVKSNKWSYKIHLSQTIAYPEAWKIKLQNLTTLSSQELNTLDESYTLYLSEVIKSFIDLNGINDLDFVCSHGHTALHQPEKKITRQIGNLPALADALKQTVVCDFRIQDVEKGGQGAPLVPIGDRLLFSEFHFCLNLGGFANVSYENNEARLAFDICPVNSVLNVLANALGYDYDDKGKIAASGKIDKMLLANLNKLEYYTKTPPKSLGVEWVNASIWPIIKSSKNTIPNVMRTFVEHAAIQIATTLNASGIDKKVLVTGGGAYNQFLIRRIQAKTKHKITIPDKNLIDYKEALIFSLLGVLKFRDEINCLKTVTGAEHDHSSGKIYSYKKRS